MDDQGQTRHLLSSSSSRPKAAAAPPPWAVRGSSSSSTLYPGTQPLAVSFSSSAPTHISGKRSKLWTSLLDHIVHGMRNQQLQAPTRQAVLEVLEDIVFYPNIYMFLHKLLRDTKVRTQLLGLRPREQKHGISHLGVRPPGEVLHIDPRDPTRTISCEQYNKELGTRLQHPYLPCVEILSNALVAAGDQGAQQYKSFPLELVWVNLQDMCKPAGDDDSAWPSVHLPDSTYRVRIPPWIADGFSSAAAARLAGSSLQPHQPAAAQPPVPAMPAAHAAHANRALLPAAPASVAGPVGHLAAEGLAATAAAAATTTAQAAMQQPAPPATASAAVGLPDDPFYMSSSRTANGSTAAAAAAGTSKAPNAAAATGGPAAHAAPAVQPLPPHAAISVGFNSWVSSLYPSQEEKPGGRWGAVLQAVQEVLHMKQSGQLWSVAAIHKVGSFQRSTNLRGSHDLDLLVELNPSGFTRADFDCSRDECLDCIAKQLCSPPAQPAVETAVQSPVDRAVQPAIPGPSDSQFDEAAGQQQGAASNSSSHTAAATADVVVMSRSGWQVLHHRNNWLRLVHPVLQLQLDVQVCQSLPDGSLAGQPSVFSGGALERKKQLLQLMIAQARLEAGLAAEPVPELGPVIGALASHRGANRHRTALLTPLMSEVVAGTVSSCQAQYGYNPDSLVTDAIRAVKAWSKFGLPCAFQQQAAASAQPPAAGLLGSSSSSSPDHADVPAGYVWEIFVIYVLQQKLQQAQAAGQRSDSLYSGPNRVLLLFMDVLEAASRLLRPPAPGATEEPPAIALCSLYTCSDVALFKQLWGPAGPLCCPYIISPVDPSFNCTKDHAFKGWARVAYAAGQLHQQMQAYLASPGPAAATAAAAAEAAAARAGKAAARADVAGGSSGGGGVQADAWVQLLKDSCSLAAAVAAFRA